MQLSCGGKEGGWMKIASIVNGDVCPSGWTQITSPVKACRATSSNSGCYPVTFTNNGIPYQHVCGKVVGYQKGTPDGFYAFGYNSYPSKAIDGPYVDGVSLTYGTPRKHLWTYANGVSSNGGTHQRNNCPCAKYPGTIPPTFVRDHYYCDSGNPDKLIHAMYYTSNVVWDGKGCIAGDSCCSQAGMPWFYRQIPIKIDEPIEARICYDQSFSDEGVLVGDMELYVQ